MRITFHDFKPIIKLNKIKKIKTLAKICLVQMVVTMDVRQNLEKINLACKIAQENYCRLIVFPEDSFWGVLRANALFKKAKDIDYFLDFFSKLAKKHKLYIFAPTVPYLESNKIYNTSFCFDNSGKIINIYKKINLSLAEDDYQKGSLNNLKIVNTSLGAIGQTICWDLINPLIFRQYAKLGAKIIINQSCWYRERVNWLIKKRGSLFYGGNQWNMTTDYRLVNNLVQARANENNLLFIFCNAAGEIIYQERDGLQKIKPIGSSQVVLPIFGKIASGKRNKEEVSICNIPEYTEILNDYEKMYGVGANKKPII